MNAAAVVFDPLVSWPLLALAGLLVAAVTLLSAWRGLAGWWLRAAGGGLLLAALANPALQREERQPLDDIVIALVDRTASQELSDRSAQVDAALEALRRQVEARPGFTLEVVTVGDAPDNAGTLLMGALAEALARLPRDRVAGILALSDGLAHDAGQLPELPAPLHLLQSGRATDWDRRLVVGNAPAFAILGEEVTLVLRVEDQGDLPPGAGESALLEVSVDGATPRRLEVPVGQDIALPLVLEHGGVNVVRLSVGAAGGELTTRNNAAVVRINAVRDRLRVLLVSGEPYQGGRTWRNLLKSDGSVDLVHFTILRPPEKQDGAPVSELSLIAFPTRELFLDKIDQFDLIIFDRYRRRGILPGPYLENVRRYVEEGGAVLVTAGPGYGGADSLFRSPLGEILPAAPTSRVVEAGFLPEISETGRRHPVTRMLEAPDLPEEGADSGRAGKPGWGRWFRQVEVEAIAGHTVMSGAERSPLLVLDRVGEGRVALLASDHVWLWSRGFEGGGPHRELLRRLAHWLMQEPELEEEALSAEADGLVMTIRRQTLGDGPREVQITAPDGTRRTVPMEKVAPGRFEARFSAPEVGLYRLAEGGLEAVVALGPPAPREFEETVATPDRLAEAVGALRGGVFALEEGFPEIRLVGEGRRAAGRGWLGLTPRGAYRTLDVLTVSLVPGWLLLLLACVLLLAAWLREGRSPGAAP